MKLCLLYTKIKYMSTRGGEKMLEYMDVDRIVRAESKKVKEPGKISSINKQDENGKKKQNFKENLKQARKLAVTGTGSKKEKDEKELIEGNIIVENSLNEQLEKNRTITRLVNEKFVNNPNLKQTIDFDVPEEDD